MVFIVLIILLGLIFYPYILTALSTAKMLSKLRRIAKREAYHIIPLKKFLWFQRNFSKNYDFLIEGRGITIAVKLFSAVRRNSGLVIKPDGTASISSKQTAPMEIYPGTKKKERVGDIFGKNVKISELSENWNVIEGKNVDKVLLVYPSFSEMVFFDGREEAELRSGDTVFEHTIYTPYGLEQKLCISAKGLPQGK